MTPQDDRAFVSARDLHVQSQLIHFQLFHHSSPCSFLSDSHLSAFPSSRKLCWLANVYHCVAKATNPKAQQTTENPLLLPISLFISLNIYILGIYLVPIYKSCINYRHYLSLSLFSCYSSLACLFFFLSISRSFIVRHLPRPGLRLSRRQPLA